MFEKRGKDPLIIPASNEQGGEPKSPDCELASSLGSGRLRGIVVCSAYGSVHALAHIMTLIPDTLIIILAGKDGLVKGFFLVRVKVKSRSPQILTIL